MNILMKMGALGETSEKNGLLTGLGMGSVSPGEMSKFKKILSNLTKSEKSFSSDFIRGILNKSHNLDSIDSKDIPVSAELINFLYNKIEADEDVDIEVGMLEGLMQQFIRQALKTGGPIAFEVENETHGKIAVSFDPKSKKLTVESDIAEELVANENFMNIFANLDVEKIEFIDSKTGKGNKKLLAYKGIVDDFSEAAAHSFSFKKKKTESAADGKSNAVSDEVMQSGKSASSEKVIPLKDGVADPTDNKASKKAEVGQTGIAATTKSGFAEKIIGSIKPDGAEQPKLSQEQAVEAIKNTLAQSKSFLSGKSGKFQVTMDVSEKGVLTISSEKQQNTRATQIQVETTDAKDWIKSALTSKGIDVDEISIQVKTDFLKSSQPKHVHTMADIAGGRGAENMTPAFGKVSGMVKAVMKKIAAADDHEISTKEKSLLSDSLKKLEAKINQAIANGGKVEHTIKAGSGQAMKWLEKELKPIADEIVKQNLPVSKLTVAKEESVKAPLKSEIIAGNQDALDVKSMAKDTKPKAAANSINLINADKTSDDEDFSGESQLSKNGSQVKESLTMKDAKTPEFKIPAERADGSQTVNISTSNGQAQFNVINGKLVGAQRLDGSNMPEMIQKIAELAQNQSSLSSHKLEVQMDIKDMGKVMVDALRHADKINLQIQVESSDVRRVLEAQLKPFIEQMAKEGIDIGKLDVSVRDEKQGSQMAQDFSEGSSQNRDEKQAQETLRDFFSGFGGAAEMRQDFKQKQVRQKVTGNQTLEIWA